MPVKARLVLSREMSSGEVQPSFHRVNINAVMVPIKLTLQNFLCYRGDVPPLDFRGIHLACLSGQNGHGKSALLDAITWALWGKARARDDSLIYYGADEMRVDLEFKVRDDCYRVSRRRAKPSGRGRSGSSDLQLHIANDDEYTIITRNSLRETEAEIQRIVGMDYDTFINSAFLLQGRADEFTNKTPGQRKEVLGKLIGLGEYDALQERAKDRAREKGAEALQVEGRLQTIQQELARKPAMQEKQQDVARQMSLVEEQLKAKQAECNAFRTRVEAMRADKLALGELGQQEARGKEQLDHLQGQVKAHRQRIERYKAVIASRDEIRMGMQQLEAQRGQYERMNEARTAFDQLRNRESELSLVIGQECSRLEEQVSGLQRLIQQDLEPAVQAMPHLKNKLQKAQEQLAEASSSLQALEAKGAALVTLTGDVGRLESEMKAVKTEGEQLREKQNMMKASDGYSSCPLCGTPLSDDQCHRITASYQAEIDERIRVYLGLQGNLKRMTGEKTATEEVLAGRPSLEQQKDQAQRAVAFQDAEVAKASQAADQLAGVQEKVAAFQGHLERQEYATQQQAHFAEVQVQLSALGYSTEAHQKLYREVQEAQSAEEQSHRLKEAEEALPKEIQSLELAQNMHAKGLETLEELQRKSETISATVRDLPGLEDELARHTAAEQGLQRSYRTLLQQQGDVEGDLRRLDAMEAGMRGEQNALLAAQEAQGLYEELQSAFGRQGVQAMLIDTLLPKVEDTANELLARMTDGRMHVKLETQRERRGGQGTPIETLDITISDELGARAYELFSGGEAFRINLALRIALSKELARRRGAPLPTLFIDEGFGTQDTTGRDRILDVISAIEPDFEKIFVITHLEDLKDAFPVHIQVEKDERGAFAWIAA